MSEVRPQLLITVVHGTWPRGLFPKIVRFKHWVRELMRRKRLGPLRFWFEESSPFLDRLSAELDDIPHKIRRLLWSGANSIFVRDETAHILAEHLSTEHAEYPQATQLVIAHSHGGNIALRALHLLHQPDSSRLCEADGANPIILVTLATPFIEVRHADFGDAPTLVRLAVAWALWIPSWVLMKALFPVNELSVENMLIRGAVTFVFCWATWWYCFSKRATRRRQNHVEALATATQSGKIVSAQAQRLLIIRAVDDEASLALAFSAVVNFTVTRVMRYMRWIIAGPISVILLSLFIKHYFKISYEHEDALQQQEWYEDAIQVVCSALILFLFGLLSAARAAPGRELAKSPLECQINTQSTPDAKGLSEIITLVRRTHAKSLRHGIYDHEDCAKTISDWVHSQLYVLSAR